MKRKKKKNRAPRREPNHGMLWGEDEPDIVTRYVSDDKIERLQLELEALDGKIEAEKRYLDENARQNPPLDPAHLGFCEGKIAAWADARNQLKNALKEIRK